MNTFNGLFVISLFLGGGLGAFLGYCLGKGFGLLADTLGITMGDYSIHLAIGFGIAGIAVTARWWAKNSKQDGGPPVNGQI